MPLPLAPSQTERHLSALERRADHLDQRIDESTKVLSYDVREAAALRWAVAELKERTPECLR